MEERYKSIDISNVSLFFCCRRKISKVNFMDLISNEDTFKKTSKAFSNFCSLTLRLLNEILFSYIFCDNILNV